MSFVKDGSSPAVGTTMGPPGAELFEKDFGSFEMRSHSLILKKEKNAGYLLEDYNIKC